MSKQYGLIIPGQQKKPPIAAPTSRPTIFDESSSGSEDNAMPAPQMKAKSSLASSGPSIMERRMARRMQEKALAEDPTVFQYDELYDEMEMKREDEKQTKRSEPRKPKYIGHLLEHAERRKLENELRFERQVQKEREAEGEMYKDKETYVTAAYRKKLEDIRKMQEQEKRDEYLESIGDVTKQKDLDGFYRHLYEQKTTGGKDVKKPKVNLSEETEIGYVPIKSGKRETEEEVAMPIMPTAAVSSKQRVYRKRRSSDEEAPASERTNDEERQAKKSHLQNNMDADSDFSIDSSSSDSEADGDAEGIAKQKQAGHTGGSVGQTSATKNKTGEKNSTPSGHKLEHSSKGQQDSKSQTIKHSKASKDVTANTKDADDASTESENANAKSADAASPKASEPKPKIDKSVIWLKRTVGEVYDAAVKRYYERKAACNA